MGAWDELFKRGLKYGLEPRSGFQSATEQQMTTEEYRTKLMESILQEQQRTRVAMERVGMKLTVEGTHIPFNKVFQNHDVLAGEQRITYYDYTLREGMVFLVDQISTSWFADCYWEFQIDNVVKEGGNSVEGGGHRIIGSPDTSPSNNPYKLPYPLIAKRWVRWRAWNDSTTNRNFSASVDGLLVPKKNADFMGGIRTLPG